MYRIFVLLLMICSPAFADTPLESMGKHRTELDKKREALEASIVTKQCPPGEFKREKSPDFKSVCSADCKGLTGSAFDACDRAFWSCHKSYGDMLKVINRYNEFLNATCATAAKDRAAQDVADAAKARAKQIERETYLRDMQREKPFCYDSAEVCLSACNQAVVKSAVSACGSQCKENGLTMHCFLAPGTMPKESVTAPTNSRN